MKTITICLLPAVLLLSTFLAPANSVLITNEVWISPVGVDGDGNGTAADPYVRASATTFDALFATNIIPINSTIHLMAGTFLTGGYDQIPSGSKLRGAGIDVTKIQMVADFTNFARAYGTNPVSIYQNYPVLVGGFAGDGTEVSDLTVDCNVQNQNYSGGICINAVQLVGSNVRLSRTKAINWGTTCNVECFVFLLGANNENATTNITIEDCVVIQPAQVYFGNGADAFFIGATPANINNVGGFGWVNGAEIRNCRCFNVGTGSFGNPNYFKGVALCNGGYGERVDGNLFINVSGDCVAGSCGSLVNCTIDNNMFINASTGIALETTDTCNSGDASVKANIKISNNLITTLTGGTALSLSGFESNSIAGLDVENNLVKAADGSGAIGDIYVSNVSGLTIKNNTLDANGGSTFAIGSNVKIAQINDNQNIAGALVNPSGWVTTNLDAVFVDSGGNITLSASLTVNGSLAEVAGKAYEYDGVNLAYGITSLYDYFFGGGGNFTTTGADNTAVGFEALSANTTGYGNNAIGWQALQNNTTGFFNVVNGAGALEANRTGSYNIAEGVGALASNTNGGFNVAIGDWTLADNLSGSYNTASGSQSLFSNTSGFNNTAVGAGGLYSNTIGNNNVALGLNAGYNLTTGSYNIEIANMGLSTDSGIIRIGSSAQTDTYLAGIVHAPTNLNVGGTLIVGSTAVTPFGLSLIGSTGASTALTDLGLPNTPSIILTNNESQSITLASNLVVNGNVMESAGQSYEYGGVNIAYGITSLYDYFFGGAGNFTTTGVENTAVGYQALSANTTGYGNNAIGWQALHNNSAGFFNVVNGAGALSANTTGSYNIAEGVGALGSNTNGGLNVAIGQTALGNNISGSYNTASGSQSLFLNTSGFNNTAVGAGGLYSNTIGNNNIALGLNAGYNLTTGSYNIDIGNMGLANESGIIRIGSSSQTDTYLAGVIHVGTNLNVAGTLAISNGLSTTLSNRLAAVKISIVSSPYFWTNVMPENVAVYINGLNGSVGLNGALLFGPVTNAPITVMLQPNEYLSITNTVGAPVLNWHPF